MAKLLLMNKTKISHLQGAVVPAVATVQFPITRALKIDEVFIMERTVCLYMILPKFAEGFYFQGKFVIFVLRAAKIFYCAKDGLDKFSPHL